jgi:hypothetical protein
LGSTPNMRLVSIFLAFSFLKFIVRSARSSNRLLKHRVLCGTSVLPNYV